jgi:hypothetical protein
MAPADSAVNDSTSDFSAREEILEALKDAHVDSLPEAGWNPNHPAGWKKETGGVLWKLPGAGAGYKFVQYNDPAANACGSSLPASLFADSLAPVPGAVPEGGVHVHPNFPFERIYGCDSVDFRGARVPGALFPGQLNPDGTETPWSLGAVEDSVRAGSDKDWKWIRNNQRPLFLVTAWGYVIRMNVPAQGSERGSIQAWRATSIASKKTEAAKKCAWVKKYQL